VEADEIPFCKPAVVGRELDYVCTALSRNQIGVDGPFSRQCQDWIASRTGVPNILLTTSCTTALEMAVLLADVGPGDEVIMPSYTFASCANAVALRGGVPVFVDVQRDQPQLDPEAVAAAVTSRSKAIMAVHYGGNICDIEPLCDIAERHRLILIEDAAHSFLSTRRGRHAATFGHLGAYSFDYQKNISAGEAGALVINDADLMPRAEILHLKGMDRKAFLRGETTQYAWQDLGSSFAPSEIAAAVLLGQFEHADEITRARRALWARYHEAFAPLERAGHVQRPRIAEDVEHNAHIYFLLLPDVAARDRFIAGMKQQGISAAFHFVPLDTSPAGRRFGRAHGSLVNTRSFADRLVRLPLWHGLEPDQARVIEAATALLKPDRRADRAGR
jgi:dTDP-4-amino-4,6-dideoxygalactose transaminase